MWVGGFVKEVAVVSPGELGVWGGCQVVEIVRVCLFDFYRGGENALRGVEGGGGRRGVFLKDLVVQELAVGESVCLGEG